ncbi:hypothetical protein ACIG47_23330 [Promicromonospora sp. NPDC052451]|uniref:hypothetical protein n=1 Tax=Promicromonospora sp. NPDC052451 TaxID=3364407 RepID=UPI0037C6FF56
MQELVGRLTALDPEASETLKAVAYFDALIAGGVGLDALLRGAAVLSGAVAGAFDGRRAHRVAPDGSRLAATADGARPEPGWPTRTAGSGTVWLEREGPPHANDAMVVERLALAVDLATARRPGGTGGALDVALDAARDVADRRVALSRLRLDGARDLRVAAHLVASDPGAAPSTVVVTPHGLVRATVLRRGVTPAGPAGIGFAGPGEELPESFRTALLAFRLVPGGPLERSGPEGARPDVVTAAGGAVAGGTVAGGPGAAVVDAAELGVLLAAVVALEPVAARLPDVVALARLDVRSRAVLEVLAVSDSVRAAATTLGMHHSTLQARHEALTGDLGYDPRSPDGRTRHRLASLLLRLSPEIPDSGGRVRGRRPGGGPSGGPPPTGPTP